MKKILFTLALSLILTSCGGSGPKIEPLKVAINNGSGTDIIGHQSVTYAPEEEVTDEYIKAWYEKIKDENNNHDVIIYQEYKDYKQAPGIFHSGYNITKHQKLEIQEDGTYMMADTGEEIFKIKDGQLEK